MGIWGGGGLFFIFCEGVIGLLEFFLIIGVKYNLNMENGKGINYLCE